MPYLWLIGMVYGLLHGETMLAMLWTAAAFVWMILCEELRLAAPQPYKVIITMTYSETYESEKARIKDEMRAQGCIFQGDPGYVE